MTPEGFLEMTVEKGALKFLKCNSPEGCQVFSIEFWASTSFAHDLKEG